MKTIITPVGTSMITNYLSPASRRKVGKQSYVAIDNEWQSLDAELSATDIHASKYKNAIGWICKVLKSRWFKLDGQPNESASAEISSILKIAGGNPCKVHLLATDTLHSVMAAELIKDWFEEFKSIYKVEVLFHRPSAEFADQESSEYVVRNLQAVQGDKYRQGFQNLFSLLWKLTRKKRYGKDVIFNITGGYKAIIPALVLFAQLEDIPFAYFFDIERSSENNELIEWPKLPFGFDYSAWELLEDFITEKRFRELLLEKSHDEVAQLLVDYSIVEEEDVKKLTPVGTLLSSYLREKTDIGKSMFGFVAELLVFEYFVKKGRDVVRGVSINPERLAFANFKNGDSLEVDIVIRNGEDSEEWYEIKPVSSIKEGVAQLCKRLMFNRETGGKNVTRVGLIVYLPDIVNIEIYKKAMRDAVDAMSKFPETDFSILYFKIPFKEEDIRSPSKMSITQQGIDMLHAVDLSEFN
ncbi:MAG: hypothetical protein D6732_16320 [Methanobacteriota archaeon]|nr:MAG: hypothetical protein D6732_16320 [Euryarchaeota archaeon]